MRNRAGFLHSHTHTYIQDMSVRLLTLADLSQPFMPDEFSFFLPHEAHCPTKLGLGYLLLSARLLLGFHYATWSPKYSLLCHF